jgi:hypothetical protein
MNSVDLEKALSDVLQEDARVVPPLGFEERILARLSVQSRSSSRNGVFSAAFAAGVVAAALLLAWSKPTPKPYELLSGASAVDQRGQSAEVTWSKERDASIDQQKGIGRFAKRASLRTAKSRATPRMTPLRVVPITMAPLFVEPIEIASLIPEPGRTIGKSQ